MATRLHLGPADHGKRLTRLEVEIATYTEGYRYEMIEGCLSVHPFPELPAAWVASWAWRSLRDYQETRPDVINYTINWPGVFVPDSEELTAPIPDLAAYHDFPFHVPVSELRYEDFSPVLVVEVMSGEGDEEKDLQRNPLLYRRVPSIREYWVLDTRLSPETPALIVYRRQGSRWRRLPDIPGGGTYATPLLPGFALTLNTRG